MGMFDTLKCFYPLPITGANELEYQTKDTPAQFCDEYEIHEDGTLWYEEYDVEDRSDPTATGVSRLIGMMTKYNERWVKCLDFTGEVRFYSQFNEDYKTDVWIEFRAYFKEGNMLELNQLTPERRKIL